MKLNKDEMIVKIKKSRLPCPFFDAEEVIYVKRDNKSTLITTRPCNKTNRANLYISVEEVLFITRETHPEEFL